MNDARADTAEQKRADAGWLSRERALVVVLVIATACAKFRRCELAARLM